MHPRDLPRVPRFAVGATPQVMAEKLVAFDADLDDISDVQRVLWHHGYYPSRREITEAAAIARATKASEGSLFGIVMAAVVGVVLFALGMLLVGPAQAAQSVAYEAARIYALLAALAVGIVLVIALALDMAARRRTAKEKRP
ncbi:hypothetical protein [Chelatococcus reniformis]|uniref:Uncharacterized protein n=1 Tax=Chelatococcus reniformis TaxID=1494448 RepID=A0A916UXW2_9HYPH|nr:hypothetical protein [Chelatococcus reniformis]GGC90673.1 hypothetical protein GCM10010994_55590 [Chelatococcus reniformis]